MNDCFLLKAKRAASHSCTGGGSQSHRHYRKGKGELQKSVPITSEKNLLVSEPEMFFAKCQHGLTIVNISRY